MPIGKDAVADELVDRGSAFSQDAPALGVPLVQEFGDLLVAENLADLVEALEVGDEHRHRFGGERRIGET